MQSVIAEKLHSLIKAIETPDNKEALVEIISNIDALDLEIDKRDQTINELVATKTDLEKQYKKSLTDNTNIQTKIRVERLSGIKQVDRVKVLEKKLKDAGIAVD